MDKLYIVKDRDEEHVFHNKEDVFKWLLKTIKYCPYWEFKMYIVESIEYKETSIRLGVIDDKTGIEIE